MRLFYYFDKLSTENVASIEVVSFTFLHKLPKYLTKSNSLNDFALSKGLGSYELSISVLDKRTQKAEVFAVRTPKSNGTSGQRRLTVNPMYGSRYIVKP